MCIRDSPAGGILSGNGIVANYFNPFLAGEGYNQIRYEYGSGNCFVSVDTVVLVGPKLDVSISQSKDTICVGEEVKISSNAVGGNGNYIFSWDNGLSNSFEHFISPASSTTYNLTLSDGCSEDVTASFYVFVHSSIDFTYKTDKNLISGVKIQVGSLLIDTSVSNKLKRIKQSMIEN